MHAGVDLLREWQRRRVRYLLSAIDHLPRNSHYAEAVSQDEEHALLLSAALDAAPASEYRPPMSTWSPEVAMLADLIDAVNGVRGVLVAANRKPGSPPPEVKAYPRPGTMLEKVRREQRRKRHEELVARVLPNREQEDG